MPRKRKTREQTFPQEAVEAATMKESDDPPAKLRNIANLIKKSEDSLFGSNIFSSVTLSAMHSELQHCSGDLSVDAIFKRKSNLKAENSSDDIASPSDDDCVLLSQGSTGRQRNRPGQPLGAEPETVQYSKKTLEVLSRLDALQKEIESEQPLSDDSSDSVVCLDVAADEEEKKVMFRVLCLTKLLRFSLAPEARFAGVLEEIAKECNVPVAQVMVCDDHGYTIEPKDTPRSVGLKPGTILQCFVRRFTALSSVPKKNLITVKFQCAARRKPELVKIAQDEPLQEGARGFAEIAGLTFSKLVMEVDGEKVDPSKTPKDLGIEDGDCVDVSAKY